MLCSNKWVIHICLQVSSPFEEVARNHARTPRVRVLSRLASPAIIGELTRRLVNKQDPFSFQNSFNDVCILSHVNLLHM